MSGWFPSVPGANTFCICYSNHAFNVLAAECGEPVNLEKVICLVFWPDICTSFSMDSVQASNVLFVPLKVSMGYSAAYIMVSSIIMDDSILPP